MLNNGKIKLTATCGDCLATEAQKKAIYREIYLEGVTKAEVEEWVTRANSNTKLDIRDQQATPINIIKNYETF